MVIHKNATAHDSGDMKDTFFELKKGQKEPINKNEGEIISLNIEPAHFEDAWVVCGYDAKAIVKARNLKWVDIFFYCDLLLQQRFRVEKSFILHNSRGSYKLST